MNSAKGLYAQPRSNQQARAMTGKLALLLLIVLAIAKSAWANEASSLLAPAGYQEACTDCHAAMVGGMGDHLYRRHNRLIQNYTQLSQRVNYCSQGAKTGWSLQHNQKVVDYLNQRYYHFKKTIP